MPRLAGCKNELCPLKNNCFRATLGVNTDDNNTFYFIWSNDDGCPDFWDTKNS